MSAGVPERRPLARLQSLPTSLITKHEAVEVTVAFVVTGSALAALAMVLGRAWRPLP